MSPRQYLFTKSWKKFGRQIQPAFSSQISVICGTQNFVSCSYLVAVTACVCPPQVAIQIACSGLRRVMQKNWRDGVEREGLMSSKPTVCHVLMRRLFGATSVSVIATLWAVGGTASAQQNSFHTPPVFTSENGTLDILMNLKQQPIPNDHLHVAHHRQANPPERLGLRDL
jgi:hypothetical protein